MYRSIFLTITERLAFNSGRIFGEAWYADNAFRHSSVKTLSMSAESWNEATHSFELFWRFTICEHFMSKLLNIFKILIIIFWETTQHLIFSFIRHTCHKILTGIKTWEKTALEAKRCGTGHTQPLLTTTRSELNIDCVLHANFSVGRYEWITLQPTVTNLDLYLDIGFIFYFSQLPYLRRISHRFLGSSA